MKRTFLLLSLFLVMMAVFGVLAESGVPEKNGETLLMSTHVGLSISAYDRCGDNTAAAVLTGDRQSILCVAEKQGDEWKLTINNPMALRQSDCLPKLSLDADDALYWPFATFNEFDSS